MVSKAAVSESGWPLSLPESNRPYLRTPCARCISSRRLLVLCRWYHVPGPLPLAAALIHVSKGLSHYPVLQLPRNLVVTPSSPRSGLICNGSRAMSRFITEAADHQQILGMFRLSSPQRCLQPVFCLLTADVHKDKRDHTG